MAVILGAAILVIVLLTLLNLVVYQYGQGAVRNAADQAARAGSRDGGSAAICVQRAEETLDAVLGGQVRDGVDPPVCQLTTVGGTEVMQATITARFEGWGFGGIFGFAPMVGDHQVTVTATAATEQTPTS